MKLLLINLAEAILVPLAVIIFAVALAVMCVEAYERGE